MNQKKIIIVGGGVSGLIAALNCQKKGYETHLVEASDRTGGRLATDIVNGVICDRGFQVLLTGYPLAKKYLNYKNLNLNYYKTGAVIWTGKGFKEIHHPLRHIWAALPTLLGRSISYPDQWRVLQWVIRIMRVSSPEALLKIPDIPSYDYLNTLGISKPLLRQFLMPFFRGVLLDETLQTSCRLLAYYLYYFIIGKVAVPQNGIAEIPKQLTEQLTAVHIHYNQVITDVSATEVISQDQTFSADHVIMTTDSRSASQLLNTEVPQTQQVYTLYFLSETMLINQNSLILNGSEQGVITHLTIPSLLNQNIINGKHVVCVTVVSQKEWLKVNLEKKVVTELSQWFHCNEEAFDLIQYYKIKNALPQQRQLNNMTKIHNGISLGGDWTATGSLQGAMQSGELAVQQLS